MCYINNRELSIFLSKITCICLALLLGQPPCWVPYIKLFCFFFKPYKVFVIIHSFLASILQMQKLRCTEWYISCLKWYNKWQSRHLNPKFHDLKDHTLNHFTQPLGLFWSRRLLQISELSTSAHVIFSILKYNIGKVAHIIWAL